MTILFPTRETDDELAFEHSRGVSLVLGLIAAAAAVMFYALLPEASARLALSGMSAFAAIPLLAGGLRCDELTIALGGRRWRRRHGLVLAPRSDTGSLDDLNGVALELRHSNRGGSGASRTRIPVWTVWLELGDPRGGSGRACIGVVEEDEPRAYRLLERYARRLRVDAIDRTAAEPERRPWNALDAAGGGHVRPSEEVDRATDAHVPIGLDRAVPPTRFGIESGRDEEGNPHLVLPPHGVAPTTLVGLAFALAIASIGLVVGAAALGLGPAADGLADSPVVPILVGGMMIATGLKMTGAAISRAGARELIVDLPDALRFGTTRSGAMQAFTELPKRSIEEVSVRTPAEGGG